VAIEAKRALLELLHDVACNARFGRQRRYDLTASHEALGAVLDDEAIVRLTAELAADPRVRLEHADSIAGAGASCGHR